MLALPGNCAPRLDAFIPTMATTSHREKLSGRDVATSGSSKGRPRAAPALAPRPRRGSAREISLRLPAGLGRNGHFDRIAKKLSRLTWRWPLATRSRSQAVTRRSSDTEQCCVAWPSAARITMARDCNATPKLLRPDPLKRQAQRAGARASPNVGEARRRPANRQSQAQILAPAHVPPAELLPP